MSRAVFRIALLPLLLAGCSRPAVEEPPAIAFTVVPRADAGGPLSIAAIAGRVTHVRPGQRVVLYARSGDWWVQPMAAAPFTSIEPDGRWSSDTHLGTEYAALLVEPGYAPPARTATLPAVSAVVARATAGGGLVTPPPAPTLRFSGYDWTIRAGSSNRGGTANLYDARNAWTAADGALHLRVARTADRWTSAEVVLTRSFGYGSYVFVVRDTSHLPPSLVLSLITWDDASTDPTHREMDIEISRWGDPTSKNAQYVVQPYYVPANVARFVTPPGVLTHRLRWEPGRAVFRTVRGTDPNAARPDAVERVFTSGVPTPGSETVRMSLYVAGHDPGELTRDIEVVIEKFAYLP